MDLSYLEEVDETDGGIEEFNGDFKSKDKIYKYKKALERIAQMHQDSHHIVDAINTAEEVLKENE